MFLKSDRIQFLSLIQISSAYAYLHSTVKLNRCLLLVAETG
jgi:hypothetical protein